MGQRLAGCSVGVLPLLVWRAWSLLPNAITPLRPVCTSQGLDLQSTSPHLLFFFPPLCLSFFPFSPRLVVLVPFTRPTSCSFSFRPAAQPDSSDLFLRIPHVGKVFGNLTSRGVCLTHLLHISTDFCQRRLQVVQVVQVAPSLDSPRAKSLVVWRRSCCDLRFPFYLNLTIHV